MQYYRKTKSKGLSSVAKVGKSYILSTRKFNSEDGTETDSHVQALDIVKLKKDRQILIDTVADYDELINDIEKL